VPQPLETWGAVRSFDKTFRTMAAYTASVETVVARDENGSVNGNQGGLQGGEEVRQKDEPAAPAAALAAAPMAAEEAGSGDMQMRGAVEVPDDEGRSDNDADTSSYGNLDGRSVVTTKGIVKVTPGNIVAIVPGHNRRHNDPAVSRNIALQYLAKPIVEKGELLGYDEKLHQLVIPRTPFKPGTRDHWPDKGAHITVALQDPRVPAELMDMVTEEAMVLDGREVTIAFTNPMLLEGMAHNDEACNCVFYLALETDEATEELVANLRSEINMNPQTDHQKFHMTVAGVAPVGEVTPEALAQFRAAWVPPRPADAVGMPPVRYGLMRNEQTQTLNERGGVDGS